jgi:hypothetical protein
MTATTYDEALTLARRLPLAERLRLASVLVDEAVSEVHPALTPPPMTPTAARQALADIRGAFRALEGPRPTLGAQLDADRADREHALLGRSGDRDHVDA